MPASVRKSYRICSLCHAFVPNVIRRVGMRHARFVVTDGPLPRLRHVPANVPVAEAAPAAATQPDVAVALARQEVAAPAGHPQPAAKAEPAGHLSARTRPAARAEAAHPPRHARTYVASDEARVLREREAWLRSLDRKYHFVRRRLHRINRIDLN